MNGFKKALVYWVPSILGTLAIILCLQAHIPIIISMMVGIVVAVVVEFVRGPL